MINPDNQNKFIMQTITLSGFLSEDSQVRKGGESGAEFLTFTVASKDSRGETTFVPCTWFQTHSKMVQYLRKGAAVIVTGELQIWDSEKDGVKYRNFRVSADRVNFAPQSKKAADSPSDDLPE